MRRLLCVATVVFMLVSLNAFAEEIRIGGGGAAMNTAFRPVQPHFEKASGINLSLFQSTPKHGFIELANGKVDAAVAAVSIESMIGGAEKDGVKVNAADFKKTEVAQNRTAILLHKSNMVPKLSKDQLKGIFTGKINNWKEVGGKDGAIIVVWGKATPGQNAQFVKEILDGEKVIKEVFDVTDYASIKESVSTTPEAIGIDPIGLADQSVRVPETPALLSPIIIVTKGEPSANVKKLIDFMKGAGAQYIKK
ncbi:MAG: phosphate ABC transporter substrate-binding protein [Nitrospirae bacterium]|nr:MAG: phosphate ABC transporter substrate-binding protein [Nitrospirota bacterium]